MLLGVEKEDDEKRAKRLAEKVLGYRIFSDEQGKMNLNAQQRAGSVTVYAGGGHAEGNVSLSFRRRGV